MRTLARLSLTALVGATSLLAAAPAQAQDCALIGGNLVLNCGFESGGADWSLWRIGLSGGWYAHSGGTGLSGGAVGSPGFASQSIATTVGQSYSLSFWYNSTGAFTNQVVARAGGQTLLDAYNLPGMGWVQYDFDFTATSGSTLLELGIRNDPSWDAIDDVSVTANVTATPEPASLALMGSGLALIAGVGARRRRGA